ncbi:MAG: type II toxin-antitoxin system RelE/ParE family toxin [Oscillospiraceae bacterium]|jgi:addiction module RelE/StbE family toxin|nr:type II toxin-antitoxin system RelE/ParE family toxin [Oscillospiraceae bacterium]
MEVFKVKVTESAESDIRNIARYISSQLNAPTTALNMVRTIREAIANLKTNALFSPLVRVERLAAVGYRTLIIKKYMAFYIVDEKEKTVVVDRILYGRRDWQSML